MSLLIKGMGMPIGGGKIIFAADGSVWVNAWPTRGYMRIENAKIIPVPMPHGQLIDKSELDKLVGEPFESFLSRLNLKCPPTVIEAEEGDK